ncbi:MAG TPA: threonine ammonia-lyase [Oscillospiraceae bacterium]|nr:threonine ammonia-lyase [Oscillospiraceae bacterium]
MLSMEMIGDARNVLDGVARVTPLFNAPAVGKNIYIKAENLQMTGAFKLRGAYYKISCLTEEERARGVIACSAGNHAQGIAYSATKNGVRSIICMPASAPLSKIEATKNYGAEVVLVDGVYDDAYDRAVALAQEYGYTFAHPFNDERVIAGQGTIALEILEQLPDAEQIIVPIGGGGLISGVAYAVKHLKPECRVIGVQAAGAPSMADSIRQGRIIELPSVSTIADGIAVKKPGDLTFALCRQYVDEIVTVTESEIASAILTLMETQKTVAEGAGATSVAAAMFGKVDTEKKTVCLVSGGNIDVSILSRVITKGLTKTGRITEITTKVTDKPGQLTTLLQRVARTGANIISISHNREDEKSEINSCVVSMVLETRNIDHVHEIHNSLAQAGYELLNR